MSASRNERLKCRRLCGPTREIPLNRPATQAIGWEYVSKNIDAIEKQFPGVARAYVIYLAGGFCSTEGKDKAEAMFGERSRKYLGGKRALASTLEGIEVCAAMVERQAPAVSEFLAAEAERPAKSEIQPASPDAEVPVIEPASAE